MNGLHSPSYFRVFQSRYKFFGVCCERASCNGHHRHFDVLRQVLDICLLFHFTLFTLWSAGTAKSTIRNALFFFCWISLGLVVWPKIMWPVSISKSQRSFCVSFSWKDSGLCIYHLLVWLNFNFLHNYYYYCMLFTHVLACYIFQESERQQFSLGL